MSFNFDWKAAMMAAFKAVWPFIAGAFGGLLSGCSVYGTGAGVTF